MSASREVAVALLASRRIRERFTKDLEANKFVLFFQPIAALISTTDAGYREILIRFKEEEQNQQSPGMFLPLLAEQGLMPQLDRWIVSRVLKWIRDLEANLGSGSSPRCGVNLSVETIRDESAFAGYVLEEIRRTQGARALSFEIAAPDALANRQSLTRLMLPLRSAGCTFALSGYAGGEASFELAVSLGFAFIKIDGSMLSGISVDPQALERLSAINRRCHEYGMRTVCMRVESGETLETLRSIGVDFAQGFGIERPRLLDIGRGDRP